MYELTIRHDDKFGKPFRGSLEQCFDNADAYARHLHNRIQTVEVEQL
jgi:hypothetical protein